MQPQRFDRLTQAFGLRLTRRSALTAGAGIGGLAIGSSSAASAAEQSTPAPSGGEAAWLFVQHFERATLAPSADGAALTLDGVGPSVLAFTDRPFRLVSAAQTGDMWGRAIDPSNPPNAALLASPADGSPHQAVVVELLQAAYDESGKRLNAVVRVIGELVEPGLATIGTPVAVIDERQFGAGHLFVDDVLQTQDCDEVCSDNSSYYADRFQDCYNNIYPKDCDRCNCWMGCNGDIDVGVPACGNNGDIYGQCVCI